MSKEEQSHKSDMDNIIKKKQKTKKQPERHLVFLLIIITGIDKYMLSQFESLY